MKSIRIVLVILLFATAARLHPSGAKRAGGYIPNVEPAITRVDATSEAAGSARNLVVAGLVALAVFLLSQHLYLLAQQWRLRAVVEERAHLAHEMHDTLAQSFAGLGFQLQAIRNTVPPNSAALERQVDLALELARSSHEEVRRCIASLRREPIGTAELLPALRACAERMISDGSVTVQTHCGDAALAIPPLIKDTLFRIGQEAIANSIRHAGPSTIRIGAHRHRSSLCLTVEDDGAGFVTNADFTGFGLVGMRNRAESISATMAIKSAPGFGTRVEVMAPLNSRFDIVAWPKLLFHT